jgi:hypothetical protein
MSLTQNGMDFVFKSASFNWAMNSAFLWCVHLPPPSPCPVVFARLDWAVARCATDAGVALVVERMVRDIVFADVVPNFFLRPIGEGVDFDYASVIVVKFHLFDVRSRCPLLAP